MRDHTDSGRKPQLNLIDVISLCKAEAWPADVVGRWVWVRFPAKPSADVIAKLKANGFRWSPRRGEWSHDCGHPSAPARGYAPRDKYGSVSVGAFTLESVGAA